MWVPKYVRDEKKGVDSPIPTQVVSNEELLPRPQHDLQKQVEALTMEMGGQQAKKLGMERRDFMRTAMGMAMLMNAVNVVFRRVVKNFDDDMTMPNISRLYDWNMYNTVIIDFIEMVTNIHR